MASLGQQIATPLSTPEDRRRKERTGYRAAPSAGATPVAPARGGAAVHAPAGVIPRRAAAGADIVRESMDSPECVVIIGGWAAPYKLLGDGRRQLLDLLMERDGLRICRDEQGRAFAPIVALTECLFVEGSTQDVAPFGVPVHGGLSAEPLFAAQQRRMMDRMAILGHGRAAERLASCLLDLWVRQSERGNVEDGSCPIPIRQSDLGDAVGLTAVHVCRTLTIFRQLGMLEFANGRLRMLRPDKLALLAGRDPERI